MSEVTNMAGTWNADEEYWKVREGKSEIRSYSMNDPEQAALLKRLLEEDIGRFAKHLPIHIGIHPLRYVRILE